MNLELVTVRRGGHSKYAAPFDEHEGYKERWWNRPIGDESKDRYVKILHEGLQVARVQLDENVGNDHYDGVPHIGGAALEIQFIEVSDRCRGQGIGTAVVHRLAELHSDRRLVVYSEEADDFWSRLGWRDYYNPERGPGWRTLFIQPETWGAPQ